MAGVLQHLRSSTLNKRPNPASMVDGQVAINYASGSPGMFFKDSNGSLVKVGPVHVGSTAPNVSPASGGTAGNSLGEQWLDTSGGTYVFKIWDGGSWRSEAGEFVNSTGDTMTGSLTMGPAATLIFEGSTDDGFETTLTVVNPTVDRTITLPNVTGTVITTGDTGTVTSTMLLDGTILDADVNASAAIAGTKISPNFGSQTITTTGIVSAALGAAATPSITFTGDTNTGIYSPGADQLAISTNGTGRLFVDANGRVGIGASAPTTGLAVIRGDANQLALEPNNSATFGRLDVGFFTNGAFIGTIAGTDPASNLLRFGTSSTERLRITSAGLVGVGTSAPVNRLDVEGGVGATYGDGIRLVRDQGTVNNVILNHTFTSGNDQLNIAPAGNTATSAIALRTASASTVATRMFISPTGSVGINTTSPGNRLHVSSSGDVLRLDSSSTDCGMLLFDSVGGSRIGTRSASIIFDTGSSERARITSAGNVGIGTTSPSELLHVTGGNILSTNGFVRTAGGSVAAVTTRGFRQSIDGTELLAIYHDNNGAVFNVNLAERARIDSSGRLLVGTSTSRSNWANTTGTDPNFQIEVNGNARASISRTSVNEFGPQFWFGKTRGTAYEVVSSADQLGEISFMGADGTELVSAASITAAVDGTPGANDMPGRIVLSTTADGASSPTERMRITQNGFTKHSNTGAYLSTTAAYHEFRSDAGSGALTLNVSNSSATGNGLQSGLNSDGTAYAHFIGYSTSAAANRIIIWSNGNVVNTNNSYGAISDVKLKENIVDANSQWSDIKSLQVRNYNFKEGQTHTQIGLIAQEVELVSPGLVSESPDRDEDGNDLGTVTKSVNYSVLYMKAVKALQEAMERIEVLEQRLNDAGIN